MNATTAPVVLAAFEDPDEVLEFAISIGLYVFVVLPLAVLLGYIVCGRGKYGCARRRARAAGEQQTLLGGAGGDAASAAESGRAPPPPASRPRAEAVGRAPS